MQETCICWMEIHVDTFKLTYKFYQDHFPNLEKWDYIRIRTGKVNTECRFNGSEESNRLRYIEKIWMA